MSLTTLPARESLVSDIPVGDGETITFFTVYCIIKVQLLIAQQSTEKATQFETNISLHLLYSLQCSRAMEKPCPKPESAKNGLTFSKAEEHPD
jgi:hypothetical protein